MSAATILVVEDNPITRKMLRYVLEGEGYEVVEAADGAAALRLAAERRPDLVLLDNVLPDMDGLQILERLRNGHPDPAPRVLMLTGMVSRIEELRARAGGNVGILAKPVEPARLVDAIRAQFAAGPSEVGKGRRVLVVDDQPFNRKLARLRLRDAGFLVETADGGEDALRKARVSPPDVLVSDVLMPGMDGFALCRAVREDPLLAAVPVILVSSAYVDGEDQRLARDMGANALIARTPELREVLELVVRVLGDAQVPPPVPRGQDVEARHRERVQGQLEKQVARNDSLLRQAAIQAAALSVVRGLSEALSRPQELPDILGDILVHCLDAAGLSTGLLYLVGPDGALRLRAHAGVSSAVREGAEGVFGHPELVAAALEGTEPTTYSLRGAGGELQVGRELLAGLGSASAMIVPFVVLGQRHGALLLASDSQDLAEDSWRGFGGALAVQFAQTIALGMTLSKLARSEERLRCLADADIIGVGIGDMEGRILDGNRHFLEMLGYGRADLDAGKLRWDAMTPPEWHARDQVALEQLRATGRAVPWEKEFLRKDGSRVPIQIGVAVLEGQEIIAYVHDISERKQAELRLKQSEGEYRLLFESNPHPMWVFDEETLGFLAVNKAAVQHYGYTPQEFQGMTVLDIRPTEEVPAFQESLRDRSRSRLAGPLSGTWKHVKKDGTRIEIEAAASPITFRGRKAWLALSLDVTERRSLEAQLQQSQKMESVGRLAGGVAHDFNNLLGIITGYAELLRRRLPAGDERLQKYLGDIQRAAERAAGLTRQLLAFSRKQVLQPRILSLNAVVGDTERMLRRLIGEDIQLITVFEDRLGSIRADAGQIEQVLMNLSVNARDAMPRGGRLTIETANVELDASYARLHPDVEPGPYVMLSVSDTGEGMDAEIQGRIFEPFFTTKEPGEGTGLGLSTVQGIAQQSGGHVCVYSEVGRGTAFKVYLPRTDVRPEASGATTPRAEVPGGTETILLVEDEAGLRELVRECLQASGYAVLEARHATGALEIAETHPEPIHLLLSDVVMPGLGGRELAQRIGATRPETKVLYMSGYTDDAVVRHGVLTAAMAFLQKPFAAEDLLLAVRDVLDGRA